MVTRLGIGLFTNQLAPGVLMQCVAVRVGRAASGAVVAVTLVAVLAPASGVATSAESELRLVGGNKLVAHAWHCGTYVNACSWQASAKLLGHNPSRARWIKNTAEVKAHGFRAKISIGRNTNVEITERSRSLIKTRWINRRHWISWSAGKVRPNRTTFYVSTKATASAAHRIFGRPRGVTAYAGAF